MAWEGDTHDHPMADTEKLLRGTLAAQDAEISRLRERLREAQKDAELAAAQVEKLQARVERLEGVLRQAVAIKPNAPLDPYCNCLFCEARAVLAEGES